MFANEQPSDMNIGTEVFVRRANKKWQAGIIKGKQPTIYTVLVNEDDKVIVKESYISDIRKISLDETGLNQFYKTLL